MRQFGCWRPSCSARCARRTHAAGWEATSSASRCPTRTSGMRARLASACARRSITSTAPPSCPCRWSSASVSPPGGRASTGRRCTSRRTRRCTWTSAAGMPRGSGWAKPADSPPFPARRGEVDPSRSDRAGWGGRHLAMTLEEVPTGRIPDATIFQRDTQVVARDLLDKVLVRELDGRLLWGRLVEVEAYLGPRDLAAHSGGGRRTARTEVMFGGPGHAYVYFTYGMHWCLNFLTREMGMPQAVLVRALEPGPGVGRCGGPGLVTRALSIDRALNGVPLRPPDLYVVDDGARKRRVFVTPRVGVQGTGVWEKRLLRYVVDSPALSRPVRRKRVRTL